MTYYNPDLFKPKRKFNISFRYTDPNVPSSMLEVEAPTRQDAERQFLDIVSKRKWRKVKNYEVHQKSWDF